MTVAPIIIGGLGTMSKNHEKGLEELKIQEKKTTEATALLKSATEQSPISFK